MSHVLINELMLNVLEVGVLLNKHLGLFSDVHLKYFHSGSVLIEPGSLYGPD